MKILIVEKDEEAVETLSLSFRVGWPETELVTCRLGDDGIQCIKKEHPDLVILNTNLPDMSGFDVLKNIRTTSSVPTIFITDCYEEKAVVRAMDCGADDYIVTPFRKMELLAKIKSIMRRKNLVSEGATPLFTPFKFDQSMRRVFFGGRAIKLTTTQSMLLYHLSKNPGHVLTPNEIAKMVWDKYLPNATQIVRSHIHKLREKIEKDTKHPSIILTKAGTGYMLAKKARFDA